MDYSIDTSSLLDGRVRYYPPDVFPQVWVRIEELVDRGVLCATEEVKVELAKQDDEVYNWACAHAHMFVPIDEEIQRVVSNILAGYAELVDTRRNRSGADAFVIALAQVKRCAVVTGEKLTNNPNRPHIPDVCRGLGIRCLTILELFRELGWRFD